MLNRIWRQRRRVFILAVCSALAVSLVLGPGLASLVAALTGGLAAMAIVVLAPQARQIVECFSLALPLVALAPVHSVITPMAAGLIAVLIHLALYGRWSEAVALRLRLTSRRVTRVDATPAEVWAQIVPGAGDQFWDGRVMSQSKAAGQQRQVSIQRLGAEGVPRTTRISFLSKVDHRSCRFVRQDESGDEAVVTLTLTPPERGSCIIESEVVQDRLPLCHAFARWMDDVLGDELDSFAAQLNGRRDWSITGWKTETVTGQVVARA